jgi:hypothetical protein
MANDPSLVAFGSLAESLGQAYAAKKQREYEQEQQKTSLIAQLVSSGLQSGTIKNPQQAFDYMIEQFGGGKGKNAKQGQSMLKSIVGATQAASKTAGGQERPSFSPVSTGSSNAPAEPQFYTGPELAQQAEETEVHKATALDQAKYEQQVREAQQLRKQNPDLSLRESLEAVGFKMPSQALKFAPGSVIGSSLPPNSSDIYGQPVDPTKYYRQGNDPSSGTVIFVPTEAPPGQQIKPGTPADFFKQAELEAGHPLSMAEMMEVRNRIAKAGQAETPEQKEAIARAMAEYRNNLPPPTPPANSLGASTTTVGGQTVQYLDLSTFPAGKEREGAREAAEAGHVIPLTAQNASAVKNVDTARLNFQGIKEMLVDTGKLPTDPTGRFTTGLSNKLGQYFQTQPDLAAFNAWREAAIQGVKALAGAGSNYRISMPMINLTVANDIPSLDDTVGTAQDKLSIVNRMLDDAIAPILVRNQATYKAPPVVGGGAAKTSQTQATQQLQGKGPGRYKLPDGSTWQKDRTGAVSAISQADYDK